MTSAGVLHPSAAVGSWFPSGFYGHSRSQSRNDIYNEYRHFVKPNPPRVFYTRLQEKPDRHVFSHHDNRFSFITDATYLDQNRRRMEEEGVGKKRRSANVNIYRSNGNLIAWDKPSRVPTVSVYRSTFDSSPLPAQPPAQPLVYSRAVLAPESSPEAEAEERNCTSYRYAFGRSRPNRRQLLVPSVTEPVMVARTPSVRARRLRAASVGARPRESVADCLVWHRPTPPAVERPKTAAPRGPVPEATEMIAPEENDNETVVTPGT